MRRGSARLSPSGSVGQGCERVFVILQYLFNADSSRISASKFFRVTWSRIEMRCQRINSSVRYPSNFLINRFYQPHVAGVNQYAANWILGLKGHKRELVTHTKNSSSHDCEEPYMNIATSHQHGEVGKPFHSIANLFGIASKP